MKGFGQKALKKGSQIWPKKGSKRGHLRHRPWGVVAKPKMAFLGSVRMKRPKPVQKVLKKGSFWGSGDPKMTPFWTTFGAHFGPPFEQVPEAQRAEMHCIRPWAGQVLARTSQKGVPKMAQNMAHFRSSPKWVQNRGPGSGPKKEPFLGHFWTQKWPFLQAK